MHKNSIILIVDDNPTNIDILVGILEDYEKKVAINGLDALMIASEEVPPDIILLDVMMPEMDGYQVCEKLRQNEKTKNIPVIFLTAKTSEEDIVHGFEVGGQDYVTKPFSPSELLARVNTQLQLKQKTDELIEINHTLEERVKERTRKLKIAKEKAEESDRLKSEFLSSMSHEIRTPLNAICGFSSIIAENNKDTNMAPFASTIQTQTEVLLTLINDIIDFAKIESNSLDLHFESFEIGEILNQIYLQFNHETNQDLILEVVLPQEATNITTDKKRLIQVISNLLSNAIKFTSKGAISFGASMNQCKEIEFFVKDTGIGISEENQKLIFNRFYKVDTFSQGTGLGLSISKNIVEILGGTLNVESELNKGTLFQFSLPVAKTARKPVQEVTETVPEIPAKQSNVLIAEDMESNQLYLKEILKGYNLNISFAWNGQEAIDVFKSENNFDLILMDLKMPVLSGIDAVQQIRKIDSKIPIIAVTAYAYPEEKKKIEEAGFNGFVTKPINRRDLIQKIYSFID